MSQGSALPALALGGNLCAISRHTSLPTARILSVFSPETDRERSRSTPNVDLWPTTLSVIQGSVVHHLFGHLGGRDCRPRPNHKN